MPELPDLQVFARNLNKLVKGSKVVHVVTPGDKLKNGVFEMSLSNREQLVLTDWSAAANVQLNPENPDSPDALSTALNLKYLKEKLKGRAAIKNILLDQKVVRGIGNAYADEILWMRG